MVILKYFIGIDRKQKIELPKNADIVKVGLSLDTPCLWVIIDPEQTEMETVHLDVCWTGDYFDKGKKYIGTIAQKDLTYHVFVSYVSAVSEYITIKRDHYVNTLEVLRSMFNTAQLYGGVNKTDELLKTAKQL